MRVSLQTNALEILLETAFEQQSLAIDKMKKSWDIFADQISGDAMLTPFDPAISQTIRKVE